MKDKPKQRLVMSQSMALYLTDGRRTLRFLRVYSDGTSDERIYSYGAIDPVPQFDDDPAFMWVDPDGKKHKVMTMAIAQFECFRHFFAEVWE